MLYLTAVLVFILQKQPHIKSNSKILVKRHGWSRNSGEIASFASNCESTATFMETPSSKE